MKHLDNGNKVLYMATKTEGKNPRLYVETIFEEPGKRIDEQIKKMKSNPQGLAQNISALFPRRLNSTSSVKDILKADGGKVNSIESPRNKADVTRDIFKLGEQESSDVAETKASVRFLKNKKAVVSAISDPDVSSPVHELAHIFERDLHVKEKLIVRKD